MNRKNFLKGLGLFGIGTILPAGKSKTAAAAINRNLAKMQVDCILIPHETAGPYPLDLSDDETYFRQDVTEGKPGLPLTLTVTVVNIQDNCLPVKDARIDIWHTDKDGVYSGYPQPGIDTTGETFCRGIQVTDAAGQVTFNTIYPGWYPGRITHIHFQVFISNVLSATSQMAFPEDITALVYDLELYDKGQNTTVSGNEDDGVFASPPGDLVYEMLTLTGNTTDGYTATMTVGIDAPVTGLSTLEPETGGQFKLVPNYPNPFRESTNIKFILYQAADVKIEVFSMQGIKMGEVLNSKLSTGEHEVTISRKIGNTLLAPGNYAYQLTTENSFGRFKQVKVMTVE